MLQVDISALHFGTFFPSFFKAVSIHNFSVNNTVKCAQQ